MKAFSAVFVFPFASAFTSRSPHDRDLIARDIELDSYDSFDARDFSEDESYDSDNRHLLARDLENVVALLRRVETRLQSHVEKTINNVASNPDYAQQHPQEIQQAKQWVNNYKTEMDNAEAKTWKKVAKKNGFTYG